MEIGMLDEYEKGRPKCGVFKIMPYWWGIVGCCSDRALRAGDVRLLENDENSSSDSLYFEAVFLYDK